MGVSTDGILVFGVDFGEEHEFPWRDEEDSDINKWWRTVNGFVHKVAEPDWEATRYPKKETPEVRAQIDAYFDEQREWDKANPLPIEEVRHCSGEYPMFILAVKNTYLRACRGYPIEFADGLPSTPDATPLVEFCEKYGIKLPYSPRWILTSMWW